MKRPFRGGFTAISLVISMIIIAVIAFFAIYYYRGQESSGPGNITSPIERARSVECLAQVRKIETEVRMYYIREGAYPAYLPDLNSLDESDLCCPVSGNEYIYDPETGQVSCPDHIR